MRQRFQIADNRGQSFHRFHDEFITAVALLPERLHAPFKIGTRNGAGIAQLILAAQDLVRRVEHALDRHGDADDEILDSRAQIAVAQIE